MNTKRISSRFFKAIAVGGAGMMLASSCSTQEIQTIISGVEVAARFLNDSDTGGNFSFGDWVASALD